MTIAQSYSSMEWTGELIRLDADENTWFLTPESIAAWHVDWEHHGGILSIVAADRQLTVCFPAGDNGEACSEALSDLDAMRRSLREPTKENVDE